MSNNNQLIEDSEMFRGFVEVANICWSQTQQWDWYKKATLGKQLVAAADSVGANISEGAGRYGQAESIHFFIIARGSARETEYWLNRCIDRNLIEKEIIQTCLAKLNKSGRLLNALISYRRKTNPSIVSERVAAYDETFQGTELEDSESFPQDSRLKAQDPLEGSESLPQDSGLETEDSPDFQIAMDIGVPVDTEVQLNK